MKTVTTKFRFGAAFALGLLLAAPAGAWWVGNPWYQRYGSGQDTYERQNLMRDHGWSMQDLAAMFEGRRGFKRDQAVQLARELEAGLGESMLQDFSPGTRVARHAWVWRDFGAFRGYAIGAEKAAGRLADALAEPPDASEMRQQGVWMTSRRPRFGRFASVSDDQVSMDAIRAYDQLNATCQSCHMRFRGYRW